MGKITVYYKDELVKIAVIGTSFSCKSDPQSNDSCDETARVEITSHQYNTQATRMFRYNTRSISVPSYAGENW